MRSAWFTQAEVRRMVRDGTVKDAQSIAAFALLMLGDATTSESDVATV
jgi:8-oxo-dGDP phosphatase